MKSLYPEILPLLRENEPGALATVVQTRGSTPQKVGAQAVFLVDGRILGTVGGGCLEAETRRRALTCLDSGQAQLFELRLDEDWGWDDGLLCGGTAQVFVEPLPRPALPVLQALEEFTVQRQPVLLATVVAADEPTLLGQRLLLPAGSDASPIGDLPAVWADQLAEKKEDLLASRQPAFMSLDAPDGQTLAVYLEPILPRPVLVIAGAGHVGAAVCHLGAWLDFEVVVLDDRPDFAQAGRLPEADRVIVGDIEAELRQFPLGPDTYVVIVTRGHRHDLQALRACLGADVAYLGMIGSRRKVKLIFDELRAEGVATEEQLQRVHAPIGLPIGGQMVEEIAVSIAAELVAVRNQAGPGKASPCASA